MITDLERPEVPVVQLETMLEMMIIDNATGKQSLVQSFDLITWWIFTAAMYLDETPIYDKN